MSISNGIPKDFYKLFNSKYMEYYQKSLVMLYEESSQAYSLLGLTEEECQAIINEMVADNTLDWSEEQYEDEGKLITKSNMASIMLGNLEDWGWLRRDYDEQLILSIKLPQKQLEWPLEAEMRFSSAASDFFQVHLAGQQLPVTKPPVTEYRFRKTARYFSRQEEMPDWKISSDNS